MLRARLFGGMEVEVDRQRLPVLQGLKARAVLAYLLLHPGPHERARLAPVFWPDVLDTSARASLRGALWAVRGSLESIGAGRYLLADRRVACIAPDLPREVDAERVDLLLEAGDPASVATAAGLASAPLLPELTDEWALAARDRHRDRLVAALERLGDAAEREGDLEAAVDCARRCVALDPLNETAHRALVRRLATAGRRSEALAAYQRCSAALAAELGVAPSPETRALAAALRAPAGTPLRGPPRAAAPALIGRDAEVASLRRAWASARAGRGGIVVIGGEAGIGKSRLALEAAATARADGARCATGSGIELEGGIPLAPWVEAVSDLAQAVPAPPPEAGWPADLARLTPAVEARFGRPAAPPAHAPDLERARLFEAAVQMVAWACAETPLLLVLEDLHLGDPASLALLSYLGRRLEPLPAMLVVTRRSAVVNAGLETALEALRRRGDVLLEIDLAPLSARAVLEVVEAASPGLAAGAADRAAAAAEGNPLLARQAARALAAGLDPAEGLRSGVRGPLAALPDTARLLVDVAAAAARPLSLGEAAELVGAEALPDAVAAGVGADLLDAAEERRVRFSHALLRQACYAEIAPSGRARLHARLAAVLASRACPSAEVARHLRLAGDDAAARERLSLAAAEARALGALDEAAQHLREALELAPEGPQEAELWLELAGIEAWRGRRGEWEDAVARALEILRAAGDPMALAAAHVARAAWLKTTICFPAEALEAYREALDLLASPAEEAPELRALALAGSAWAEAMAGDPSRVEGLVTAVEAIPETAGDPVLVAELALARAGALVRVSRLEEAEERYEAAAVLAEAAGRADLALVAWASAASAAACRGDFARALHLAERGGDGGAAGPSLEAFVRAARAYALSRTGRHDEALEVVRGGLAEAERLGGPDAVTLGAFDAGAVALAAGRPAEAARLLDRALDGGGRGFSRPLARLMRAEALVAADPAEAEAELDAVAFETMGADAPDTLVARMARVEGLIAAARGDHESAVGRLDEAEAGWRRRLSGDPGDAFAATLVDLGRPPVAGLVEPGVELGRTLADRATSLAALGRADEAAAAAAEAGRLADELAFDGYRHRLPDVAGVSLPKR